MPEKPWFLDILKSIFSGAISRFMEKCKEKMKRYAVAYTITAASLAVIIYGIGSFFGSLFPMLPPGVSHIITGLVFVLIGWRYMKSGE